ncbi:MAG: tRNA (adenosine(37)-N6)-threonylcarbamoyltransferase complex transferase subunit TsaD [Clostridia bacterium]|nr:tRNA (adenosine(37)-N6)-threonylcarbamoyltransferase complex transferase subunit TsaD [Clostridia bacterium]
MKKGEKVILALETSCDETSAAVVSNGSKILANVVSSQIRIHQRYGGVVPEIASRKHMENINYVVKEALEQAQCGPEDLDAVAVTYGPGLVGALLVGLSFAKAAAYALNIPLIGVNHLAAHIYSGFLVEKEVGFPIVSLVVSGGHTNIIHMPRHGHFEVLGQTRDDAAGEVLDKIARAMGLKYPGGPEIEKLAQKGDPERFEFPRAWLGNSYDFSFSGLKSSVLNFLHNAEQRGEEISPRDAAAGFQEAIFEVLIHKTTGAAVEKRVDTVMLVGGVAANKRLRSNLKEKLMRRGIRLIVPPIELCTDNAAMVGCAAHYQYLEGRFSDLTLNAIPNLGFGG